MELVVDLYITRATEGAITVTVQTTPLLDKSRLNSVLSTASMSLAPSSNGFTVSVARPTELQCKARVKWWVAAWEDITS